MANIKKIYPGQILYDVKRASGFSRWKWDVWDVKVVSVSDDKKSAVISWNNNPPFTVHENSIKKYRLKPPTQ